MLQISVRYLCNDIILPVSRKRIFAINEDGKLFIDDTYLRKYMTKHIKQMNNRYNITCGYKTCISFMLLRYYLNK